jgi:hypothetical protein
MAEITPPRIGSTSDPNPRPQDQPLKRPRVKAASAKKPALSHSAEVSAPDEEEKHELDEMA